MSEQTSPEVDALIGQSVEGFRIESLLGAGGMGRVYKAYDTRLARYVAIKLLTATTPELLARFEREMHALSAVNHPNVAQIYSTGSHEGTPYYVLEYLNGGSLAQFLQPERHLPGQRCLSFLQQAASGLAAAHARGIVHRDVKPSNLMLLGEDHLKVVDFGLARRLVGLERSLTESAATLGTPLYMSPEQALGKGADHRSDIYSLGAAFYHLLAGLPPFEGDTPLAVLLQQVRAPLPPLRERNPRVPAPIAALVERMLAKAPADRPQTYAELLAELDVARAGVAAARPAATVPSLTPAPVPQPVASAAAATGWVVPTTIGVAVVVMIGLVLAGQGRRTPAAPTESRPAAAPSTAPTSPLTEVLIQALGGGPAPETTPPSTGTPLLPFPGQEMAFDSTRYVQMAYTAKTAAAMRKISIAIEVYRSAHDQPLPDLRAAVEFSGLKPQELVDGWGRPIQYETIPPVTYRLRSWGPDGVAGNQDDIVIEDAVFIQGDPSLVPPPAR